MGWAASTITRWSGENRYITSAVISQKAFSPGVPVAFIASGREYPDALSGAPVAGDAGGPVLLSERDSLSDAVRAELTRLNPAKIVILGGPVAIAESVAVELDGYTTGDILRWSGPDRYATSAAISASHFAPGVSRAFVASGRAFPDALSGAAAAGCSANPVLLTDPAGLSSEVTAELTRLAPDEIVVLGGAAAVSDSVLVQLDPLTTGPVTRVAGDNRYATSAAIATKYFAGAPVAYLASGQDFPDALSGAAVAGNADRGCGPILLAAGTGVSNEVRNELVASDPAEIIVLGGPNAVSEATAQQAANPAVQPQSPSPAQPQPSPAVQPRPASPDLDCKDFASVEEAQVTYDYWVQQGRGDVHGLDADHDGRVCERGV